MSDSYNAQYFSDIAIDENQSKAQQARRVVLSSSGEDAEKAAKATNLAQDLGVPKQAVQYDLEHYEREKNFSADYFTKLGSDYPTMIDFVSDPDNASIVHDDMTYLEKTAKTLVQVPGQVKEGYYDVYLGNLRNKQLYGAASEQEIAYANELSQRERVAAEPTGFISDTALKVAQQVPILGEVGLEAGAYSVAGGATALGVGMITAPVIPEEIVTVPMAMRAGGAYGAFNASRRLEGGLAFDEFLSFKDADGQPLDENVARGAAMIVGITNGAVELIPLKKLAETVPGIEKLSQYFTKDGLKEALKYPSVREALSDIGQRYAKAIVAEGSTEIAQEAMTMYTGELIKAIDDGDFEALSVEEQVERLAEAGKSGMQVAAGLGLPGSAVRAGKVIAEQTGQPNPMNVAEYVRNARDTLANSDGKLMTRSKPKMREYIDGLTEGQTFYLDAGATSALYQKMSEEQKQQIINAIPDFEASLDGAVRTKDSFEIPAADFFTYIQPFDEEGVLDEYVTLSPEHYSAADLNEIDEMISDLMDEAQALEEQQTDGDVVENNIYQQLLQNFNGRKAPSGRVDVARLMSQNPRAFYETMLERSNQDPRVKEILDRLVRDIVIRRQVPNLERVLKIDELDLTLDRVRDRAARRAAAQESGQSPDMFGRVKTKKKKGKAKPTPVISWLGKRVGLRPGGAAARELAAMDITPKSHPRLFKTKGIGSVDNIPAAEFNEEIGNQVGLIAQEDENGYVDQGWLLEQMRNESFGEGALTQEQRDAEAEQAYLDDIEQVMQMVGVDLDMPNADIKEQLQRYQDDLGQVVEQESQQEIVNKATDTPQQAEQLTEKVEKVKQEEATQEQFEPEKKPEPIQPDKPIEDFGEEISGARKHEYTEKLSKALPEDVKDFTLSKIFPEPDYDKMIADGVDVRILAAVKAMRDRIPSKPRKKWKLERWADELKIMRAFSIDLIDGSVSIDDLLKKMDSPEFKTLSDIKEDIELYIELGYPTFKNAKGYAVAVAKSFIDEQGNKRDEPVDQWMIVKDRRLIGGYSDRNRAIDVLREKLSLQPETGGKRKTKLDIWQVRTTGEIVIGKKVGSGKYIDLKTGFSDVKEARKYLNDNEDALLVMLESKKKIAPVRKAENAPREGVDRRMGENITPEKFAREFGFRGVQFGNYVEQYKRAQDLNESYDALLDMADIIGVEGRALSLNGTLGLAFGARGKGAAGSGGIVAAAHYERGHVVINLTKKSGAGSLGHEWWHALDNYFGKKNDNGDYLSEKPKQRKIGKNYKKIEDADQPVRKEVVDAFKGVIDAINKTDMRKRATELDKKRTKTYWTTDREMTARAFESYLIYKADQKGERNDYLANIVKEDTWKALMEGEDAFPYLQPEEISNIVAPAFDNLFDTLQTRETDQGVEFYQREGAQPADFLQSALLRAAQNINQPKGTGDQMLSMLRKMPGIKEEEIAWTGLDEFLKGKKTVTKDQVISYLDDNQVQIEEVELNSSTVSDEDSIQFAYEDISEKIDEAEVDDKKLQALLKTWYYDPTRENWSALKDRLDGFGIGVDYDNSSFFSDIDETKFSQYTLPGGENYREVLLTLPNDAEIEVRQAEGKYRLWDKSKKDWVRTSGGKLISGFDTKDEANEQARMLGDNGYNRDVRKQDFTSSHYSHANILAHMRLNDRTDADGKRVLFIEEIQSDWHQAGRKKGYKGGLAALKEKADIAKQNFEKWLKENPDKTADEWREKNPEMSADFAAYSSAEYNEAGRVPDAPFKKNWHEMAFRRVAQMAAQQGYDAVSWTPGEVQNDRYDLRKQVKAIAYWKNDIYPDKYDIRVDIIDSMDSKHFREKTIDDIEDIVGKEIAQKILKEEGEKVDDRITEISGDGLKIGGEGMKGFYDKILKKYVEKFGKKYGAKVGVTSVNLGTQQKETPSWTIAETETVNKLEGSQDVWQMPITDKMRESAVKGFELFQNEGDARGSIEFTPSGQSIIRLFEKEDLSTFMHEAGHLYWRAMSEIAALDNAPEQVAQDVATVRKWVGAKDGATLTVEQEEKIADAFLEYIRKGDAPSVDLQSAFQRMKGWLMRIYRGVRDTLPKINKDISDVFDRMLATDDAIERVRTEPAFKVDEAILALLPKAQADRMRKKYEKTLEHAKERILKKAIRQAEAKATKTYKKERGALQERITKEVEQERTYAAMDRILEEGGLSRKGVTQVHGKEAVPYLSGHGGLVKKGGQHPDVYADILGYRNGYEMLMDFMNAEKKKDRITRLTDQAMLERYGDMLNDGSIDDEAMRLYHNRLRKEVIALEMKALAELGSIPAPDPDGIEAAAIKLVGDLSVSKLQPGRYLRAENRAYFDYGKALGQGNYARAARAKAQQLLNHHMYKMTADARETVEKSVKGWRRFGRPDKKIAKAKSINIDYVYAIRAILARHDIGRSDFAFQDWFEQLRAESPDSAQALAQLINMNTEGAKPYKDLSVDEFMGLKDSIEGLIELGRDTLKIELDGKRLTAREAAQAAADTIYDNNKERDMSKHYEGMIDKARELVAGFDSSVTRMEFILKAMEGNELNGTLAQMFMNPLAKADAREQEMHKEIAEKFREIIEKNGGVGNRWKQKVYDQRLDGAFTVRNIVTIALNMGNEGNLEKLLDGYSWEYADVKDLVERYLTKEDMDTVQEIWDLMETLRPDLQRVHKEVTGFPMEIVKAQPLETKWGTYKGGYFPVVYDIKRSDIGARNAEDVSVFESNFTIPSVGKGMTKSRSTFSAPVDLDFESIVSGHFAKTIHLITHGTAVKDLNRVIMNPIFKDAIIKTAGVQVYNQFKPWLQAVAANRVYDNPVKAQDKVVRHLRVATTNLFLGFSVTTGIKQTLGMTATYAAVLRGEVSQKNFFKSLRQYYTAPASMSKFVMENSAEMQGRIRKMDANVAMVMSSVSKLNTTYDKVMYAGMAFNSYSQMYTVDMPTWIAGYNQAMDKYNGNHEQAVNYADALVRQTQGSGAVKDLSVFQRGTETEKAAWAMFGTYIIGVLYPKLRELGIDTSRGNVARSAMSLTSLLFVPAILEGLMSDPPEDDEGLLEWTLLKSMLYGASSLPIIGGIVQGYAGDFGYSMSAIESPINMMINNVKSDDPEKFTKGLVVGLGIATKLPVYKPYQALDELIDQASGQEDVNIPELLQVVKDSDR